MKSVLLFAALALATVCGCSHNAAEPNTAAQVQAEPEPLPKKDSFDKAGDMFATGSRYMYDEAIQAFRWMSSDEMKAKYSGAWEAVKNGAHKAYESAKDTYNESK